MTQLTITFHNETKIRVMAQIFVGRDSFSTQFVDAKTTITLSAESRPYDIYCKNAVSGLEMGHKQDSRDTSITLRSEKGNYVIVGVP